MNARMARSVRRTLLMFVLVACGLVALSSCGEDESTLPKLDPSPVTTPSPSEPALSREERAVIATYKKYVRITTRMYQTGRLVERQFTELAKVAADNVLANDRRSVVSLDQSGIRQRGAARIESPEPSVHGRDAALEVCIDASEVEPFDISRGKTFEDRLPDGSIKPDRFQGEVTLEKRRGSWFVIDLESQWETPC